jgi:hypothetical protein
MIDIKNDLNYLVDYKNNRHLLNSCFFILAECFVYD